MLFVWVAILPILLSSGSSLDYEEFTAKASPLSCLKEQGCKTFVNNSVIWPVDLSDFAQIKAGVLVFEQFGSAIIGGVAGERNISYTALAVTFL